MTTLAEAIVAVEAAIERDLEDQELATISRLVHLDVELERIVATFKDDPVPEPADDELRTRLFEAAGSAVVPIEEESAEA